MAKYADYVKPEDQVDQELSEVKQRAIPESVVKRFDGKSVEDVLEAYANLEQHNSTKVNQLQQTINDLVALQTRSNPQPQEVKVEPDMPVTVDDLYTDTESTIAKVVDKKSKQTQQRIDELEKQLANQQVDKRVEELTRQFPTWRQDIASPEFTEWVKSSPYRARVAIAASKNDFDAANDLLSAWSEHTGATQQEEQRRQREQQFRDATLETAGGATIDVVQGFTRHDLQEKRLRAKQGDLAAERWLRANSEAIAIAYEEGKVF